jgi:O-antigen ligase
MDRLQNARMRMTRAQLHQNVRLFLLFTLAFSMPVSDRLEVYAIILYAFNWIAEGKYKEKLGNLQRSRSDRSLLLFSLLFFIYLAGMLWSANLKTGMVSVQVKLSILVLPVLIATADPATFTEKNVRKIFISFISGCLFICLFNLTMAFLRFQDALDIREFFYTSFAMTKHPSYLSMYLVLSMALLGYFLITKTLKHNRLWTYILLILAFGFFNFIYLLGSRAGLLSLAGLIIYITGYLVFVKREFSKGLILFLVGSALYVSSMYLYGYTADRMAEFERVISGKSPITTDSRESTATRVLLWRTSLAVIREHPLTGIGTGDVDDTLLEHYKRIQFQNAIKNRLNVHNQYLQTWLATGLAGLLILTGCLIIPGWISFRRGEWLYLLFLGIAGFNFLFESMLERQSGVIFYAFFNAVLYKTKAVRHLEGT